MRILPEFRRDERASTLPLTAMILSILCIALAATLDIGLWRQQDMRLQEDADMAALAVAVAKQNGMSDSDIVKMLQIQADKLPDASGDTVFAASDLGNGRLRITASRSTEKRLSRLLSGSAPDLSVITEIAAAATAPACVLSLATSPTNGRGIEIDNSGSLETSGCAAQSNASGSQSVYLRSGDITVKEGQGNNNPGILCHGGGIDVPGWDTTAVDAIPQACPAASDPVSGLLSTPTPTGTVQPNPATYGWWNGVKTLDPGIYPNGLQIQNGVKAKLASGVYYVTGGDFETKNGATLETSNDVTIIFTSAGKFSVGDGSGVQHLTAPNSGPYAGVLMWRPAQASCSNKIIFNGGATFQYDGIMYFPGCEFNMSNNAKLRTDAKFTYIIADRFHLTGSASIDVKVSNPYGLGADLGGGSGNQYSLVY